MTASDKPKVAVLGAGSWGTALAALIARHGHPTVLWGRDPAVASAIDGRHADLRWHTADVDGDEPPQLRQLESIRLS